MPTSPAIHPKIGIAAFAGAVTAFVLSILKSKFNIDLSGQETNAVVIVTAIVGYFVPNAE